MKPIKIEVKYRDNVDEFREAAITFEKYGYYTPYPKGSSSYIDFWERETNRCLFGFTTKSGEFISGYNYFYLNYCTIERTVEIETEESGKKRKRLIRRTGFPRFYDYDKAFFDIVEKAENEGKHLSVLKKRGSGYSYKCASMLVRNFFLIPESTSVAYAGELDYLTKDGILTKAWNMLDFINEHTAWSKKTQKINTKTHKRASFVVERNGVLMEEGYKSEILGISLKNDPSKTRGKRAKLILFEEGGRLPGAKTAWQLARPSVEIGSQTFGLMIIFGTGGEEGANFEGMREIFYEPEGYNCLPIENIWDDGATEPCGFFVPEYYNLEGSDPETGESFMDENGNSKIELATKYILRERSKIEQNASDKNAIDRYIAEHPIKPSEAVLTLSGNIFPKTDLIKQLAFIRTNSSVRDFKQVGELYYDDKGKVKWQPSNNVKDITKYHLNREEDRAGAIVIWEHPVENPPWGLYIAGCDPYDHDKSGTNSLGSIFIYKRFQDFESYYDMIVAEYSGRPERAEDFYENVRKLLLYYNATVLYENQWPGLSVYMRNKHSDYLLADQPDIISKIIKDSKVNRSKGIHMVTSIKDYGELELRDWLNQERSPGKKNLHYIFSEPLLEELIAYNKDGNFDRVIALMLVMIYKEELHNVHVKKAVTDERSRYLFPDGIFRTVDNNLVFI